MVELAQLESQLPDGLDICFFSSPSRLYLPAVPRCFKDAKLERDFVQHQQKLISRRLLTIHLLLFVYFIPRSLLEYVVFVREQWTPAALFEVAIRTAGTVGMAIFTCLLYLRPDSANEIMAMVDHMLVFVWILVFNKHRCAWLFQETTAEAFNLTINSDSVLIASLMSIVSTFFICMPVRVSRSWIFSGVTPMLYLAYSLPVKHLEQSVVRLLTIGALLSLQSGLLYVGKVWTETSDRTNYAWQITLRKEVTAERVLRYSAEHQAESGPFAAKRVHCQLDASSVADSQLSSQKASWSEVSSRKPHSAPSVCMMPDAFCLSEQGPQLCESGDCIPKHYLVQTPDGAQEVGSLSVGQQILCLDNLTAMQRFAEVADIQTSRRHPDTPVAKVTLEDGSSVEATLDHPMPARLSQGSSTEWQAIPAGRLQPGLHNLVCMKQVSLGIASVKFEAQDDIEPEESFTALSVRQPDRFGILMSRPGTTSMIAVGSFCMQNRIMVRQKNTFLECNLENEYGKPLQLKRSMSCPELQGTFSRHFCGESPSSSTSKSPVGSGLLDNEAQLIPIGERRPDRSHPPPPGSGALCLPPLSVLHEKHALGKCKPCRFHRRYKDGKPGAQPCTAGDNCRLCHFDGH